MRKLIKLGLLKLLFTMSTFGQIVLDGSCDSTSKKLIKIIAVYRPIEWVPQPWYADKNDDMKQDEEGRFRLAIDARNTGLFYLGLPNGQVFMFFRI